MDTPVLLKEQVSVIKPKSFSQDGLWGGAVGGLICALMVISMKGLGYDTMAMSDYVKLWPRILFFGTVGGGAGGWLSSWFATVLNQTNEHSKKRRFYEFVIFCSGFLILSAGHQLSVRTALQKHRLIETIDGLRVIGGFWGHPNFQTLAAGLLGGAGFIVLVRSLSRNNLSGTEAIRIALKTTVVGVTFWGLTYLVYFLLTGFSILEPGKRYPSDLGNSTIFIIDFKRPEYTLHFAAGCFIYVYSIITWLCSRESKKVRTKLSKSEQEFLDNLMAVINENMNDFDFGPTPLAEKVGVEMRSLNRKLKTLYGKNTTLLIREFRLKSAASLIEDNFGNITEICHEVGFRSLSYFERSFKQYYGLSPKNYRGNYKKNLQ